VLVPGRDQSVHLPRDLGVTVAGPLPAGTELSLVYDPRLYTTNKRPTAVHEGNAVSVQSTSTGAGKITVTLKQSVPTGSLTIIAGQLSPNRYPYDIVRDLGTVEADKKTPGQGRSTPNKLVQKKPASVSGEPWGAECGALWDEVSWGDGNRYYRPLSASVRSTGPGPIPPGSTIRILCDQGIVPTMQVVGATDSAARQVLGSAKKVNISGVTGVEWRTKTEVPAGEQVLLRLESTVDVPPNDLDGVKHPTVDFIGPRNWLETQRTTFRESIHRMDITVNAEMREASGLNPVAGGKK
jgi:hypothetical protein